MGHISLGFIMLLTIQYSKQSPIENLEDLIVYAVDPPTSSGKRPVRSSDTEEKNEFIEDKLVQHTQALEHLLQLAKDNEERTKALVENLSRHIEAPKPPEKVEVPVDASPSRRSGGESAEPKESALSRLATRLPTYGKLAKELFLNHVRSDAAPDAIVEEAEPNKQKLFSRRSMNESPQVVSSFPFRNTLSPWCPLAILCRRSFAPICGFDDNFGYAKFDDQCHMLNVNCYWNYNFVVAPDCRPPL